MHNSRISRDLINNLKSRVTITPGGNKTEVESLFSTGDIVRVRKESVTMETKRIELSMLQYKDSDDEEGE